MAHIYIYSPSGAVRDKAAFKRGVARLKKLGHEVELDADALSSHTRFAGDDATRLAAIHRAADSGADVALISRGGYGLTRILPGIKYKQVAKAIAKDYAAMRAKVPTHFRIPSGDAVLNITEVMDILPHRYPFLMVDRIVRFEGENKCTGVKCVTINEPFFNGHFPGAPVMPGVLILEALAQAGGLLTHLSLMEDGCTGKEGKLFYLVKIDNAKFSKMVVPGDQLELNVELKRKIRNMALYQGVACVDGKQVAFPAPNAFGASLWIRALLAEREKIHIRPLYAKTHSNAYRSVLAGLSSAAGGINLTFDQEPPEVRKALRVLMETPGVPPHPLSAHPRVPEATRRLVASTLLKLMADPEMRALMNDIPWANPVVADYRRDYQPLEQFGLDKYVVNSAPP